MQLNKSFTELYRINVTSRSKESGASIIHLAELLSKSRVLVRRRDGRMKYRRMKYRRMK